MAAPSEDLAEDVAAALAADVEAAAAFDGLPPSHRREYLEWVEEAVRPATRSRRIARMVEMLHVGRPRP